MSERRSKEGEEDSQRGEKETLGRGQSTKGKMDEWGEEDEGEGEEE